MKKFLLQLIRKNAYTRLLLEKHFLSKHYLHHSGWKNSVLTYSSVDSQRQPIPWITYAAIEFLKDRIQEDHLIFEYGSGNSTLWLSTRSRKLISIEHDASWYQKMQASIVGQGIISYQHIPLASGQYEKEILRYPGQIDILFIDGRNRVACCTNGIPALSKRGVILFDNSERHDYTAAMNMLKEQGFKRLDFWGLGPISDHGWCTSIFYKSDNCLSI